eukprot:887098_1
MTKLDIPFMGWLDFRKKEEKEPVQFPFLGNLDFHHESTKEEETKKPLDVPFMGTLNFHKESTEELEDTGFKPFFTHLIHSNLLFFEHSLFDSLWMRSNTVHASEQ